MKQNELKPCAGCGKGVCHTQLPLFWKVTIDRLGLEKQAVMQRTGLETFFGGGQQGAVLAGVMGTNDDIAKSMMDAPVEILLCEDCAIKKNLPIAAWAEH